MSNDDYFYTDEPIGKPVGNHHLGEEADISNAFGGGEVAGSAAMWDYVKDSEPPRPADSPTADPLHSLFMEEAGGGAVDSSADLPQDINMLLTMIERDRWSLTSSKSFYEQALFMAGYADDAPIVPFFCFYPTYRQMSVAQLRSYFTVRKLLRQGKHPDVPESYLFVYAYETLMQIGVATPDEGYEILSDLRENYPSMNPPLRPHLTEWLKDYTVWYGLTNRYAESFAKEQQEDRQADLMNGYANDTDEELFSILDQYTHLGISKGALYKRQPHAAVSAVAFVMRRLISLIERHYSHRIATLCYGTHVLRQHVMFDSAVFYSPDPVKELTAKVSSAHRYTCHKGFWHKTVTAQRATISPSMLKAVLHDVDALVRRKLGVKPAIKPSSPPAAPYLAQPMLDAVDQWFGEWTAKERERKEEERRKAVEQARRDVSIDLSKLGKIRQDADVVREKLIVEEESNTPTTSHTDEDRHTKRLQMPARESEETASDAKAKDSPPLSATPHHAPSTNISSAAPSKEQAPLLEKGLEQGTESDACLSSFISLLLSGGDYKAFLRKIHTPAGVIVEKINDKAMDTIGDIVLEDDGEKITIIEDYRDDIKHLYD